MKNNDEWTIARALNILAFFIGATLLIWGCNNFPGLK